MYKCKIKVSGINNLTDARYFAAKGVDFIGFDINPESENFIPLHEIKTIMTWISGVRFVAECSDMDLNTIVESCHFLNIDCVEINSGYNVDAFHHEPFTLFEKAVLTDEKTFDMIANNGRSAYTVLDCHILNFNYEKILANEWIEIFQQTNSKNPIFLDINYTIDELSNLIEQLHPYGIQIQHKNSIQTIGEANYEQLDLIFDSLLKY